MDRLFVAAVLIVSVLPRRTNNTVYEGPWGECSEVCNQAGSQATQVQEYLLDRHSVPKMAFFSIGTPAYLSQQVWRPRTPGAVRSC